MMSKAEEMQQAIDRIGPYLFNEDSELSETVELHADFKIDDDGEVTFYDYILKAADGSVEDIAVSGLNYECSCSLCSLLWFFETHVEIVENLNDPGWRWVKISSSVKDYFKTSFIARGGQADDEYNVFDLVMKIVGSNVSSRETVSIKDFSQYELGKVYSLIETDPGGGMTWLADFHPSGEPVYWFGEKGLLVDDILEAANSDDPQPLTVVGIREKDKR